MRLFLISSMICIGIAGTPAAAQTPKPASTDSPATSFTRTKLLTAKVSVQATSAPLGEILKEFAAQVDSSADQPMMWSYGPGFPHSKKVAFSVKDKPLDEAMDLLLTKAGGGLGYVVVSRDGEKYDGWVRLTTTGERGFDTAATTDDEMLAAQRLAVAKKLIDAGKPAAAKPVLMILATRYAKTKAGKEAKELLEKMEK